MSEISLLALRLPADDWEGWLEIAIQIGPPITLFLLGLIVGSLLFRRRGRSGWAEVADDVSESGDVVDADVSAVAEEIPQPEPEEEADSWPERVAVGEELNALRRAAAEKEEESELLRRALVARGAELKELRELAARGAAPDVPTNPIAARVPAPMPLSITESTAAPGGRPAVASPGGSRRFLRRLLGIEPGGREGGAGASAAIPVRSRPGTYPGRGRLPVANLAEARAALTDLRRVPVAKVLAGGGHGDPSEGGGNGGNGNGGSRRSARERGRLEERLAERDARIEALESELAGLRRSCVSKSDPNEAGKILPRPEAQDGATVAIVGERASEKTGAVSVTAASVAAALARTATDREKVSESEFEPAGKAPGAVSSASSGKDELALLAKQADNRSGGLVLFRANDPALWGRDIFTGVNRRARSLRRLPEGIAYLRLRRVDAGDGVVMAITGELLTDDGDGFSRGFNGTNEQFYGAHHLGLFDESLPQDLETRFTFGGWGFGHSSTGPECQACGWEGKLVSSDTVFEIAVFRRMPVLDQRDRLLEVCDRAVSRQRPM